jgi:hypothetical protein
MDFDAWRLGWDIAQFAVTAAVGFYVYISNRQRVTQERLVKLEREVDGRLDNHAERITKLEGHVEYLPTHGDLQGIRDSLAAQNALISGMAEGVHALRKSVDRINDYLLSNQHR